MSAIKRYIEEQATLIAMEYGSNVDEVVYEITYCIEDQGFSTEDAIQAVRAKFAAVPSQLALYKAFGIPLGTISIPTKRSAMDTERERSVRAMAEEVQEVIMRKMAKFNDGDNKNACVRIAKKSLLDKPMEPELFSAKMRTISDFAETDDEEEAHMQADALLIEVLRAYGYDKGCDIFENMPKWYA